MHATTMTVKVRDRRSTNRGYEGPRFAHITIDATCPVCGGPRGDVYTQRFCEDGEWYDVDRWDNPCGHVDMYASVLEESEVTHHE